MCYTPRRYNIIICIVWRHGEIIWPARTHPPLPNAAIYCITCTCRQNNTGVYRRVCVCVYVCTLPIRVVVPIYYPVAFYKTYINTRTIPLLSPVQEEHLLGGWNSSRILLMDSISGVVGVVVVVPKPSRRSSRQQRRARDDRCRGASLGGYSATAAASAAVYNNNNIRIMGAGHDIARRAASARQPV